MTAHTNFTINTPAGTIPPPGPSTYLTNLLHPSQLSPLIQVSFVLLTLLLTIHYIRKDYRAFISLGPGGTPSTPLGYLKIKILSLVCLRDVLQPISIPPHFRPQHGYLSPTSITSRSSSPRPVVRGVAPQRQQTQRSPAHVYEALVAQLKRLAADPANNLIERTSCFEKHSSGLFSRAPITRVCGGEVCHAHPCDGSLHLTLHPADARVVIERGWGERHPLARGGWCRRFVPREFMLVYAPRGVEEVENVVQIVAASVWWVSGLDVLGQGKEAVLGGGKERVGDERMEEEGGGRECWGCRARRSGEGWQWGKGMKKDRMIGSA